MAESWTVSPDATSFTFRLCRNATFSVRPGQIMFADQNLVGLSDRKLGGVRGVGIGFVPQDPGISPNLVKRVGRQISEVLVAHGIARQRLVPTRSGAPAGPTESPAQAVGAQPDGPT
ncbi:hypothetical protein [Frankia gtarii]|uniref:hypothetical protein n=1 Tax=Frankia gtarii TaxID=2950102 RepID=UPI0021C23526|nr:hypothetical protein [Frankia gtarii]